jgi:hypothetical protein
MRAAASSAPGAKAHGRERFVGGALGRGGETMPSFDQTPDKPKAFGFKVLWFAVKAADPTSVLDALEFGGATPANWTSGLAAAYGDRQSNDAWVFASPAISGWVLVVGLSLPRPTIETHHDIGKRFDVLFSRLMRRFDDVQFFGSYRVCDFVAWARAVKGKPIRIFAYFGSEVLANVGEQSAEEAKLKFANLSGLSPSDANDEMYRIAEENSAELDKLCVAGLSRREALKIVGKRPQ